MSRIADSAEKRGKTLLYMLLDVILISFSVLVAINLWYGGTIPGLPGGSSMLIPHTVWRWYTIASICLIPITLFIYSLFRFYSNLWKYASIEDVYKIVVADTLVFVLLYFIDYAFISDSVPFVLPKRMLVVAWTIDVVLFIFSRSGYRLLKRSAVNIGRFMSAHSGIKRVMVVGAGFAGYNVVRSIANRESSYEDMAAVIIVDDDYKKNNTHIMGIRVTHNCDNIPRLAREYEIDEIIIAIPSASNNALNRIMEKCAGTDCILKLIPPLSDVSDGAIHTLRDVDISDLLGREEIQLDTDSISGYLKGRTVLVTGGGGSIGSELCRQIARFEPSEIIIFDVYENNAYELYTELKNKYKNINFVVSIGTIRDLICVEALFEKYKPEVVFHAAAHKHVPLMESVPEEAVKNNVFGTLNVVRCADRYGCDRFVLLSTDKAVNPTNVMGATKRITELIVQYYSMKSSTKFMAVRFGNVLGSNGSVIPLFKKQIKLGGPVTVTDPEITRYFMTIPEACRLVLQAAGLGKSGRIFVLDMGKPVKIDDLARKLIRLSGFVPDEDIKIVYTGLRPGEKLFEELIMAEERENMRVAYHDKIFVTAPVELDEDKFKVQLDRLYEAVYDGEGDTLSAIKDMLPNFKHKI